MSVETTLLNEIDRALGQAMSPSLTSASAVSDLFEAYVLTLVIEAARIEGATVSYQDRFGNPVICFVYRTSPGHIYSTAHQYTHALIEFPGKSALEAHTGVRVTGISKVLHECDVSVVRHDEAVTCRTNNVPPRSNKVEICVECKFYSDSLPLNLARAFVGLAADLSTSYCFFVYNNRSATVEQFLESRLRNKNNWEHEIVPSKPVAVARLQNQFQSAFKSYKARR